MTSVVFRLRDLDVELTVVPPGPKVDLEVLALELDPDLGWPSLIDLDSKTGRRGSDLINDLSGSVLDNDGASSC